MGGLQGLGSQGVQESRSLGVLRGLGGVGFRV